MILVSVIFYTGATYSCYSNILYSVDLEEKTHPINIRGITKDLDIYEFGIIEYYVRSESGCILALWDLGYYVPGLPKEFIII